MDWTALVVGLAGVIGGAGVTSLIIFLINRHDGKNAETEANRKFRLQSEKDICRVQLLLLLKLYPEDVTEIMKLARHYFEDLKADWYLTSLFKAWLKEQELPMPQWVKED